LSTPTPQYRFAWRGDFTNDSLNVLHPEAFGHAVLDYDWLAQVRGHSPGWVCAWATSLPWVPFQGPLELVVSVPDPQATIGSLALGIAGAWWSRCSPSRITSGPPSRTTS
jgi:hypothetical protein